MRRHLKSNKHQETHRFRIVLKYCNMNIFQSLQVYINDGNGIKIAAVKYTNKLLEASLFSDALKEYLLNYYFLDCSCHLLQ